MPPSAYVRSFLYLLYTLIKLYYTKALGESSLISGPGLNVSPPEAKNSTSYRSATTFQEPGGLQSMGSQRVGHHWVTKHNGTVESLQIYLVRIQV